MRLSRDAILVGARRIGWALGALTLALAAALVLQALAGIRRQEAAGALNTRAFVERVKACHRHGPRPRPSWAQCEQRIREASR